MPECTKERFLEDVSRHEVTILRDDGLYRHVRFSRPNSGIMRFDLVTWPGYLCYCGDVGEFVFSRIDDMFAFFRRPDGGINEGYWAEKCYAQDRDGVKRYSPEKARQQIVDYLEAVDADDVVKQAVEDELLFAMDDMGEEGFRSEVDSFSCENADGGEFRFHDFYEYDLTEYSFRFIWCCYAMSWGIRQYDLMKGEQK
jgi:hypothetical protein